jgi:hypothetical protein
MTKLLNDDGKASMATAIMMSHHGFRRDLARFANVLEQMAGGDARAAAVRAEWERFHATLHGHHEAEDHGMFPGLAGQHASVRGTIERLGADHRLIDPLLARGDRAFAELPKTGDAAAVIRELTELLDPHLACEEAELIPFLRAATSFPGPPPTDEALDMFAHGFAWAMNGIAPDVVERVVEMLPEGVRTRLPAAREAFAARCVAVWGSAGTGASRTSIPE